MVEGIVGKVKYSLSKLRNMLRWSGVEHGHRYTVRVVLI